MIGHVGLCVEEIAAEVEADNGRWLMASEREALEAQLAVMRALLASVRARIDAIAATPLDTMSETVDDLSLIRGLGAEDVARLADRGIVSYATIAAWRRADIDGLGDAALAARIGGEGWIEQAAILATGRLTHFAQIAMARRVVIATAVPTVEPMEEEAETDVSAAAPANAVEPVAQVEVVVAVATGAETPYASAPAMVPPALGAEIIPLPAPRARRLKRHLAAIQVAATLILIVGVGALNASHLVPLGTLAVVGERLALR